MIYSIKYLLVLIPLIFITACQVTNDKPPSITDHEDLLSPTPSAFLINDKGELMANKDEIPVNNDLFTPTKSPSVPPTKSPSQSQNPGPNPSPAKPPEHTPPAEDPWGLRNINGVTVLVNKSYGLPSSFVPKSLIQANVHSNKSSIYIRSEIAHSLEAMFQEANAQGLKLTLVSAYRSYKTQKASYNRAIEAFGSDYTNRYYAPPGHSEHQTGLAVDISSPSFGNQLEEEFSTTQEGIWLKENCPRFGFILRYPRGKEHITGYSFEPWHFRYLGIDLAIEISQRGLTMEEYFNVLE